MEGIFQSLSNLGPGQVIGGIVFIGLIVLVVKAMGGNGGNKNSGNGGGSNSGSNNTNSQ